MSDARILGQPAPFVFEGQTYQVAPRSFNHEGLFRAWAEREALFAVQRHKDVLTALEYAEQLAGWRHDCGAHQYAWPMPLCMAAYGTLSGAKEMAWIILSELNQAMTRAIVERIFDDPGTPNPAWEAGDDAAQYLVEPAWDQFQTIMRALNDPNRQTPKPKAASATS